MRFDDCWLRESDALRIFAYALDLTEGLAAVRSAAAIRCAATPEEYAKALMRLAAKAVLQPIYCQQALTKLGEPKARVLALEFSIMNGVTEAGIYRLCR